MSIILDLITAKLIETFVNANIFTNKKKVYSIDNMQFVFQYQT